MAKTTRAVSENDLTRRVVQQHRNIDELADTEYLGLVLGRVGQAQKRRMLDTGNIYSLPAIDWTTECAKTSSTVSVRPKSC